MDRDTRATWASAPQRPEFPGIFCNSRGPSTVGPLGPSLAQNPPHRLAMHVGQPIVAALEAVGEARVVEAQAMQNGGVEVVDVDGAIDDVVAVVVGRAVADAGLDAAAR